MHGRLFIIGTPIGNLSDMTPRAVETLRGLDVLFCEDTRVTAKLLAHFGVKVHTRALSDDAPQARVDEAVAEVLAGQAVGFAADAGMPGISDPARRLTAAAWRAGIVPSVIPGVSAPSMLIAACPFIESGFSFAGFAPRKAGERARFVERLRDADEPQVYFDSPRRVHVLLDELCAALEQQRQLLIGREMTKLHEQMLLLAAGDWPRLRESVPALGEFTVAVAARPKPEQAQLPTGIDPAAALKRLQAAGFTSRDSARALAAVLGVGGNQVKKLLW